MRRLLVTTGLCALSIVCVSFVARAGSDKPTQGYQYDVQGRYYVGNKTVLIWTDHLGEKPTVTYNLDPRNLDSQTLRVYEFIGPWVVDVQWEAHSVSPRISVTPRSRQGN